MRKFCFLFLAFCLPILFPSSTYPGEAVGVNTLSSDLRNCIRGEINTSDITQEHSAVATDGMVFCKNYPAIGNCMKLGGTVCGYL